MRCLKLNWLFAFFTHIIMISCGFSLRADDRRCVLRVATFFPFMKIWTEQRCNPLRWKKNCARSSSLNIQLQRFWMIRSNLLDWPYKVYLVKCPLICKSQIYTKGIFMYFMPKSSQKWSRAYNYISEPFTTPHLMHIWPKIYIMLTRSSPTLFQTICAIFPSFSHFFLPNETQIAGKSCKIIRESHQESLCPLNHPFSTWKCKNEIEFFLTNCHSGSWELYKAKLLHHIFMLRAGSFIKQFPCMILNSFCNISNIFYD